MGGQRKLVDEWGFFTPMPEKVIEAWPELGTDAVAMFLYLRFRTHRTRGEAWPSFETMRTDTGMGNRRIASALRTLEGAGLLERRKRFGDSVVYTLKRPPPEAEPEASPSITTPRILEAPQYSRSAHPVLPQRATTQTESTQTDTLSAIRGESQQQHGGRRRKPVVAPLSTPASIAQQLMDLGIQAGTAQELGAAYDAPYILAKIELCTRQRDASNLPGLLVAAIRKDYQVHGGRLEPDSAEARRRYVQGDYADFIEH